MTWYTDSPRLKKFPDLCHGGKLSDCNLTCTVTCIMTAKFCYNLTSLEKCLMACTLRFGIKYQRYNLLILNLSWTCWGLTCTASLYCVAFLRSTFAMTWKTLDGLTTWLAGHRARLDPPWKEP